MHDEKEEEDDEDEEELEPVYESGRGQGVWWESCHTSGKVQRGSRGLVFVQGELVESRAMERTMTDERRRHGCIRQPLPACTIRDETGVFTLQGSVYTRLPPGPPRSRQT